MRSKSPLSESRVIATPYDNAPVIVNNSKQPYRFSSSHPRLLNAVTHLNLIALVVATVLSSYVSGVYGAVIDSRQVESHQLHAFARADSPTNVCLRWAQQSALVNGTLYLYGGQATTQSQQTENTWDNNFLTIDLTKTWNVASPSISGLPQPSGPPDIALGYLWNSYDALYVYGGEFSWKPVETPVPFALWAYDIRSQSWTEHSSPQTSSGKNAPSNGDPVQRAAEGAGISVPSMGRGWYFGGHLDGYTTPGWSQSIFRVYLQSLLEYTFPSAQNDQVDALANSQRAGSDGSFRNITQGGLQTSAGFTERADGLLIYVPGFGQNGILLALAGGTNTTFTQMNNIDVYDVASSSWYKQATSGPTPDIRVNPCAVVAAASDGSSTNIYMFGGQSLQPYGNQTQYSDMWILTLPSFTWIKVDMSGQSVPYGRSGHTCNIWDGQMVLVGGYVGSQLSCESPGIYVFDLSKLQWVQQFTALSAGASPANPFSQQSAQITNDTQSGGLEGSYGYSVPGVVQSVIGGGPTGGATITKPIVTATGGPLATGNAITYVVTQPNGAVVTETNSPTPGSVPSSTTPPASSGSDTTRTAAIAVGVVCGVLFCVACYLAFCAFIYRKQVQIYKRHLAMAQERQMQEDKLASSRMLLPTSSRDGQQRQDGSLHISVGDSGSQVESNRSGEVGRPLYRPDAAAPGGSGDATYHSVQRNSDDGASLDDDILLHHEPTFVGVMLNPRRSLRVVNRD